MMREDVHCPNCGGTAETSIDDGLLHVRCKSRFDCPLKTSAFSPEELYRYYYSKKIHPERIYTKRHNIIVRVILFFLRLPVRIIRGIFGRVRRSKEEDVE